MKGHACLRIFNSMWTVSVTALDLRCGNIDTWGVYDKENALYWAYTRWRVRWVLWTGRMLHLTIVKSIFRSNLSYSPAIVAVYRKLSISRFIGKQVRPQGSLRRSLVDAMVHVSAVHYTKSPKRFHSQKVLYLLFQLDSRVMFTFHQHCGPR